jgi:uncharacterized protein (DUF1015 family)
LPQIRPFAGIQFAKHLGPDVSALVAPPFDVLDETSKAVLQAKHPNNIVTVDLPYLPPKAVGPDEVYDRADVTLQSWMSAGILVKNSRQAFYPYVQTYDHHGRTVHRRGFFCTVRISPFGEGNIIPHEMTYRESIEDRLKLMRATGAQLSPIFGLYSDTRHEVANLLFKTSGRPQFTATLDGVKNDLWVEHDAEVERQVIDFVGRKPIYIADGHHRYTTAVAYLQELETKNGGPLAVTHPANYCMFVLVGMQDDGLLIHPTHRLIGNVPGFNIESFAAAVEGVFTVTPVNIAPEKVADYVDVALTTRAAHTFGLYDGLTHQLYELACVNPDVLARLEPDVSDARRRLDVAILQRYVLEEVMAPLFAGGGELTKAYTAKAAEIVPRTDGVKHQVAFALKSTPLGALEMLGQHQELMPQKSTYFYPKLTTGLVINSVRV